jgi:glycosyltransferase involved in cell wall biosynthesis
MKSGMKVLHFLPQYPGRDGTSAYGTGLVRALNRLRPGSAAIVSQRHDGRPAPDAVDVVNYAARRMAFGVPGNLRRDLATGRLSADGAILHGTFNPPMATLGRWLRKLGIPYLFIPHDPYVPGLMDHHRWRKLAYWHGFEKPLIEGARAVQLLDESHEAPLRALGCRVPVFTVPNGCDPAMLDLLEATPRVPGAGDPVRIQYLGRMDRNHKGLDLLLEGFALFLRSTVAPPAVELVLTGNDWTDRGWLEAFAGRLGIRERVRFTGPRSEPSIRIQAEADLAVLPSRFDGFGLTLVEAMLAARPVIASAAAGVATHVARSGGGWISEPTAGAIAATLERAMADRPVWEEMGRRNQIYVTTKLTWDRVAETTMEAYERHFC